MVLQRLMLEIQLSYITQHEHVYTIIPYLILLSILKEIRSCSLQKNVKNVSELKLSYFILLKLIIRYSINNQS